MTRERVCFEGDAEVAAIQGDDREVIAFISYRQSEYPEIKARVNAVGCTLIRENLSEMQRVKATDLEVIPAVTGIIKPAAVTLAGGFVTNDQWYDTDEWMGEES
jgi:hypothetical protein